jgi:N-acetylmuramoyl-L-alanine amidase
MTTVAVCAGHTNDADGCNNADLKLFEHSQAGIVAKILSDLLHALSLEVLLIDGQTLPAKVQSINEAGAVLAVDIHFNAAPIESKGKASGYEVIYNPGRLGGIKLANCMLAGFDEFLPFKKHAGGLIASDKFTFVRGCLCPAVITEALFLDSDRDATFLLLPRGPEFVAKALLAGVQSFLRP